jgi:hypothetical protein
VTVGTGEGVWVQDGPTPNKYLEIPKLREDALKSNWSNNNCFVGMGKHFKIQFIHAFNYLFAILITYKQEPTVGTEWKITKQQIAQSKCPYLGCGIEQRNLWDLVSVYLEPL